MSYSLEQKVQQQQVDLLYSQSMLLNLANIPVALLTAYTLHDTVPAHYLWLWTFAVVLFSLLRLIPTLLYKRLDNKSHPGWKWTYLGFTLLVAMLWGSCGLFLHYELSAFQQYYVVLLLLGISASAIAANQALLPSFYAFVIPTLLPSTLIFSLDFNHENASLAVLILIYLLVLSKAAHLANHNIRQTILLRLQNADLIDDLSQANMGLRKEIMNRMLTQQKLEISKKVAEHANRAKSEFLSRMSHEFRTPLTSIIGFSQLMRHNPQLPIFFKSQADSIHNAGQHLLSLVNDLLDLSLIDAGKLDIHFEDFDLATTIHQCIDFARELAEKNKVSIIDHIGDDRHLPVHADATRCTQVFLNLITNAIKYNRENGTLTLEAEEGKGDTITIKVIDTGVGIAANKLENLFQPFDRLGAESSKIEGFGIGLSITKYLVENMHGKLLVQSRVGEGSVFTVELKRSGQELKG